MRIKIEVNRKDLERGKAGSAAKCPIARAVNRQLRHTKGFTKFRAEVGYQEVNLESDKLGEVGKLYKASLPQRGSNFITKFDELYSPSSGKSKRERVKLRAKLKPFSFALNFKDFSAW